MTLKLVPRQVARGFACLAKSDVLYHATSLTNALSILREDRLRLVGVNAVEERILGRADVFWVSMARTKTSSFLVNLLGQAGSKGVVFEVNGRKLGQVLKSVPIDYWRGSAAKDNRGHEQEERLLGRKPELAGFSRFLVAVHVLGKVEDARLAKLARLCTARGVPCLAYPGYQAWLAHSTLSCAASTRPRQKPVYVPTGNGRAPRVRHGRTRSLFFPPHSNESVVVSPARYAPSPSLPLRYTCRLCPMRTGRPSRRNPPWLSMTGPELTAELSIPSARRNVRW